MRFIVKNNVEKIDKLMSGEKISSKNGNVDSLDSTRVILKKC